MSSVGVCDSQELRWISLTLRLSEDKSEIVFLSYLGLELISRGRGHMENQGESVGGSEGEA